MTQNIYDDPDFFTGYKELERSRISLDGMAEWPAIRALGARTGRHPSDEGVIRTSETL